MADIMNLTKDKPAGKDGRSPMLAWAHAADELAAWVDRLLVNRRDRWGAYTPPDRRGKPYRKADGTEGQVPQSYTAPNGKWIGQDTLSIDLLRRHFRGARPEHVTGVHSTAPDNTCRWVAIDIDHHDPNALTPQANERAALAWYQKLVGLKFRPLLLDSNGRGGFHLWVMFAATVPAASAFAFVRWVVADHADHGLATRPETFPKQRELREGKVGNWLRLPGRHHTRDHWPLVWDGARWRAGAEAVAHVLTIGGDDPALIPATPAPTAVGPAPAGNGWGGVFVRGGRSAVVERARRYVAKMPAAVSGQHGHDATWGVALVLMRGFALPIEAARPIMADYSARCSPPWSAEELEHKLIGARDDGQVPMGYLLNDDGHARESEGKPAAGSASEVLDGEPAVMEREADPHRLARIFQRQYAHPDGGRLVYHADQFHVWDDGAYRTVTTSEFRASATAAVKDEGDRLNREHVAAWRAAGGKGHAPTAFFVTHGMISNVLQATTGYVRVPGAVRPPAWLGGAGPFPPDELMACRNGLVHLPTFADGRTGFLVPPTPRFFGFNALNYDFQPTAPPPVMWLDFLGQLWQDDAPSVATLQEWFGYVLTADTRQQKMLLLVGPKRSGKGTIARVLRALVGPENVAGPTLSSLATNFGLAPLLTAPLAIVSDARLSGRTDAAAVTERLLSITGEDAVTVDRKHLSAVTVKLPTRFMMLSNELPRLGDASGALAGRFIVLRLTKSWFGREDPTLTERLLSELPGILLWAIDGWRRLRERGRFVQPASGQQLCEDMEDLSSPVGAFVREVCHVGAAHQVGVTELYDRWKRWCEAKGEKPGTEQVFGRDLRAAVPAIEDRRPRIGGSRVRMYVGIGIRFEAEEEIIPE
jgi:putative DNA primase/helicase